ncbi:MAG: replicative DNA helicase [Patescibacteria group bacterium]|nr:replicative DNA helicase [Patescibacteria group bacterium]
MSKLRIPPQNIDSEKAVLGSVMLRPGALHEITDILTPESFYVSKHAEIFSVMLELANKSEPIDILSVSQKLEEKGKLENIGGSVYLTELANAVPTSTNIKYYAEVVAKKYLLRRIIDAGTEISELGFKDHDDVLEALDKAEKRIMNIGYGTKSNTFSSLKNTLPEAWERLEKLHESRGKIRGVPTGFEHLDNYLSGLQRSDLIIIAARPSVGKTTLALDIARQAASKHNRTTVIFSLEMSTQQLVDRMLAAESKVNAWNLRTGKLSAENEFAKIRDSLDRLAKAPIFVDDQAGNSIAKMRSVCRRVLAEQKSLDLIIVDYLQLMTTSKNYDSMVNQVTEISRSLKALAKEFNVPVIALSQLSRAIEARGGRPRLSDLRDSGSIEQDADVVMFIHREDRGKEESEKTNIAEILIEKHRNGPVGKVDLYFNEKTTTFTSVTKDYSSSFSSGEKEGEIQGF